MSNAGEGKRTKQTLARVRYSRMAWRSPRCAHRTSTILSCAFCVRIIIKLATGYHRNLTTYYYLKVATDYHRNWPLLFCAVSN